MPRPANVSRVVISGTLPGGETFAWGFWMNANYTSQAATNTAATTCASFFGTTGALTTLAALIASDSAYTDVDIYSYDASADPATYHGHAAIASGTGTSTGASLPLQATLCVSTQTGQVGARRRGRFYVPVNALNLTSHQLTATQLGDVLDDCAAFFSAINGSVNMNGQVAVVSVTGGFQTQVTSLTGDSRLDTQRRRAASEDPLFTDSASV